MSFAHATDTPRARWYAAVKYALNADGGEAVFGHYGYPPARKPYKSPFSEGRSPKLQVKYRKGRVSFIDWRAQEYKGDAVDFVRLHDGGDVKEAFRIVGEIYGIREEDFGLDGTAKPRPIRKPRPRPKAASKPEPEETRRLVNIELGDTLTEAEAAYWMHKAGAAPETVLRHCKPVRAFALEIKRADGSSDEIRRDGLEMAFAFEILARRNYKVYQPDETRRAYGNPKSKTVFLGESFDSLRAEGALPESFPYCAGLDDVRAGEPVFVTEGEADFLALKAKGFNAITFGGVCKNVPACSLEALKAKGVHPSQFVAVFDTDKAGREHAQKFAARYKCRNVVLPKLPVWQPGRDNPKENDVCDYIKRFGFDQDLADALEGAHTLEGKYLSETEVSRIHGEIAARRRVLMAADAGTGKTRSLLADLAPRLVEEGRAVLLAVPFADQAAQLAEDMAREPHYAHLRESAKVWREGDAPQAYAESDLFGLPRIHVATYDKAEAVAELLERAADYEGSPARLCLVIDEEHLTTKQQRFRRRAVGSLSRWERKAEAVLRMSATPDALAAKGKGYSLLRFRRRSDLCPKVEARPYFWKGKGERGAAMAEAMLHSLQASKEAGGVTVVHVERHRDAYALERFAIDAGHVQAGEIGFVFGDSYKGRADRNAVKRAIREGSRLPEGTRLVFATGPIVQGVNLKGSRPIWLVEASAASGRLDATTAIQLCQRPRDLARIRFAAVLPYTAIERGEYDAELAHSRRLNAAARTLQRRGEGAFPKPEGFRGANVPTDSEDELFRQIAKTADGYRVNADALACETREREAYAISATEYLVRMAAALPGFELRSRTDYPEADLAEIAAAMAAATERAKANEAERERRAVGFVRDKGTFRALAAAIAAWTKDERLSSDIRARIPVGEGDAPHPDEIAGGDWRDDKATQRHVRRAVALFEFFSEDAARALTVANTGSRAFGELRTAIAMHGAATFREAAGTDEAMRAVSDDDGKADFAGYVHALTSRLPGFIASEGERVYADTKADRTRRERLAKRRADLPKLEERLEAARSKRDRERAEATLATCRRRIGELSDALEGRDVVGVSRDELSRWMNGLRSEFSLPPETLRRNLRTARAFFKISKRKAISESGKPVERLTLEGARTLADVLAEAGLEAADAQREAKAWESRLRAEAERALTESRRSFVESNSARSVHSRFDERSVRLWQGLPSNVSKNRSREPRETLSITYT